MIERHITFNVHPDKTQEFERFFAQEYRPPVTLVPGFVACDLLREIERPDRYQMVFRWEQADAAVAWRTSDVHQDLVHGDRRLHHGRLSAAGAGAVTGEAGERRA